MKRQQIPFWILTTAIFIGLIVPSLIKDGMFMDGLFYASVAKNLSKGIGSFWYPHFSQTLHSFYFQNPPLGINIQALFFLLFGDSIYTERIYSFFTALISAYLMVVLWRVVFFEKENIKKIAWMPVIFWITIPICFWSYRNNLLENTMVIFDLLAIIFIAKFLFKKQSVIYIFIACISIFFAFITKGMQGMFPLGTLLLGWVFLRNISFIKTVLFSALVFVFVGVLFVFLFQYDEPKESLIQYLNQRVLNSIVNVSNVGNRFYIIFRLLIELLVPITLTIILVVIYKFKNKNINILEKDHLRMALFFIAIGISASFPLMITKEQRSFYLTTSLPFFAIGIAIIAMPCMQFLINRFSDRNLNILKSVTIISLASVILLSISNIGKIRRDNETIHDVHLIGKIVQEGTLLGSNQKLWESWSIQEYLIRHYYISQDNKISAENDYLLLESENDAPPEITIQKVNISTVKYHLYQVIKKP